MTTHNKTAEQLALLDAHESRLALAEAAIDVLAAKPAPAIADIPGLQDALDAAETVDIADITGLQDALDTAGVATALKWTSQYVTIVAGTYTYDLPADALSRNTCLPGDGQVFFVGATLTATQITFAPADLPPADTKVYFLVDAQVVPAANFDAHTLDGYHALDFNLKGEGNDLTSLVVWAACEQIMGKVISYLDNSDVEQTGTVTMVRPNQNPPDFQVDGAFFPISRVTKIYM